MTNNPALTSLTGLGGLTAVHELKIEQNVGVCQSDVDALRLWLGVPCLACAGNDDGC